MDTTLVEPVTPAPIPARRRITKIALLSLAVVLGGWLAWSAWQVWFTPDGRVQQIYLVPDDAAVVLHSSDPVGDWHRLTQSAPWQSLSRAESMVGIAEIVAALEQTLASNRTLFGLVGRRDILISLHRTSRTGWDFLAIIDLRKMAKMRALMNQLETVGELAGMETTRREYKGVPIVEMRDLATREILHVAPVDNHLVISYSGVLVQAAIDERENPRIGLDPEFLEVERAVAGRGLCRVWINWARLPEFLSLWMPSPGGWFDSFAASMDFAGLALDVDSGRLGVEGVSLLSYTPDPYMAALMASGKARVEAHRIMPARTALFADFGFDDPAAFVTRLEEALGAGEPAALETYRKTRAQIEKYLDISLTDDFLGWMSGEFAFAELEPGLLGREGEFILAIRARDIDEARRAMELIEKRVRGRTPIRVASVDYNGYPINYVEMKGFFRLFFGGLFARFETPFYTYVEDYVVFSNRSSSLLSFVEDHRQGNLLTAAADFRQAFSRAEGSSTLFAWMDTQRFWPLMRPMMSTDSWVGLEKNREVVWSFPSITMQIVAARETSLSLTMNHRPWESPPAPEGDSATEVDETDGAMNTEADSRRELMSELRRFHVEKFEGNVLREFYDSGALRSESEVKGGQRHGRHREFYEDGTLLLRGKYSAGQPRGTWKYYTPAGEFDRKQRF